MKVPGATRRTSDENADRSGGGARRLVTLLCVSLPRSSWGARGAAPGVIRAGEPRRHGHNRPTGLRRRETADGLAGVAGARVGPAVRGPSRCRAGAGPGRGRSRTKSCVAVKAPCAPPPGLLKMPMAPVGRPRTVTLTFVSLTHGHGALSRCPPGGIGPVKPRPSRSHRAHLRRTGAKLLMLGCA